MTNTFFHFFYLLIILINDVCDNTISQSHSLDAFPNNSQFLRVVLFEKFAFCEYIPSEKDFKQLKRYQKVY